MSVGRSIARNTIIQFIGKILTTGISLALVAFLTRKLGVSQYGTYVAILAYVNLFIVFADLGVNIYLLKRLSVPEESHEQLVADALGLRVVTLGGMIVLALGIMMILPYSPFIRVGIAIGLLSLMAQGVNSLFVTVLQSRLEMRYAVTAEIWGRVFILAASLFFVMRGYGVLWVVVAMVLGSVVNGWLSYRSARRYVPIGINWNPQPWLLILREALPISVSSILGYLYFKIDTVFLSLLHLQGGRINAVEVGIYGSSYKVLEVLLLVPAIFLGSVFPVLSNFLAKKDERVGELIRRSLETMAFFSFPIALTIYFLAPQVIQFVAGKAFLPGAVPLRILVMAMAVNYLSAVFTYTALTMNKQLDLIWIYSIALVFNVATNLILIPRYSYVAAAWTTFATEIIILILPYWVCQRALHINVYSGRFVRLIGAAVVLWLVLLYIHTWSLFPALLVSAVVYLSMVFLFKAIDKEELMGFFRPVREG